MIEVKSSANESKHIQPNVSLRPQTQTIALAATLCMAAMPINSQGQDQQSGVIRIEASGFDNGSGHAIAKLFLPGQNVRQHGHLETNAEIRDGKASFAFPALPVGDYAVVVFHDSNDNGEIDHNLIGMPKEQLGFSNAFKLSLSSGLPTFDKLRFAHGTMDQSISIIVEGL
jgi:uncharacterized protein (DUF2141 family)